MISNGPRGVVHIFVGLLFVLVATGANTNIPLAQQDDGDMVIVDGEYAGSHGAGGIFFLPMPGQSAGSEFVWAGEMDGELQFTAALGALDGEWELQSEATILGQLPNLIISGTQTGSAEGTITGHATRPAVQTVPQISWKMLGTSRVDSQVTSEFTPPSVIPSQTTQQSETMNVTLQVQEFWATCDMVNGTWIYSVEEEAREAGLVPRIAGSFWAYRSLDSDEEELAKRIQDEFTRLHKIGVQLNKNILNGEINAQQIIGWLGPVNKAMFAIEKNRDCGLAVNGSQYLTPVTFLAAQMASNLNHLYGSGQIEDASVRIFISPAYITAVALAGTGAGNVSPEGAKMNDVALENNLLQYAQESIGTGKGNDAARARVVLDAAQVVGAEKVEQFVTDWLAESGGSE